jgi:hypothetical protein
MKRAKRKTKELKCYLGKVYRQALRQAKALFYVEWGTIYALFCVNQSPI